MSDLIKKLEVGLGDGECHFLLFSCLQEYLAEAFQLLCRTHHARLVIAYIELDGLFSFAFASILHLDRGCPCLAICRFSYLAVGILERGITETKAEWERHWLLHSVEIAIAHEDILGIHLHFIALASMV